MFATNTSRVQESNNGKKCMKLRENKETSLLKTVLDDSNQMVIVCDMETQQLIYANKVAIDTAMHGDKDYHGMACYRYMFGADQQCRFCPLRNLGQRDEYVAEITGPQGSTLVKTKRLQWDNREVYIEYVTDIDSLTQKLERTEQERQHYRDIYKLLTDDYASFYYVFLDIDEAIPYQVADSVKNRYDFKPQQRVKYRESLYRYIKGSVVLEDQADLYEFADPQWLMANLEPGGMLTHSYRSIEDGKIHHWQLKLGRIAEQDHFAMVVGFLNVDKAIHSEQKRQADLQKALEQSKQAYAKLQKQIDIIGGLQKIYFATYYGDLRKGTFEEIDSPDYIRELIAGQGTIVDGFNDFLNKAVKPTSRQLVADFINPQTLNTRLRHTDIITQEYEGIFHGWCRASFVVASRDDAGNVVSLIFAVSDIENQVREEKARKEELAKALAEANRANRAKTVFLNNMSHDIRTPMNAIIGFSNLAGHHIDEPDKVKDYLNKISTSSNHLLSLINDVLDMSRIESGYVTIESQPWRLSDILQELGDIVQVDAQKRKLEFQVEIREVTDDFVICDKLRLNQVLLNCISNSIKFTQEGGQVGVRVEQRPSTESGKAEYMFTIYDNGIGMSEEFVTHIFEPFSREKSSTISGIPGTGLGMSITKHIVDMMDGQIRVRSQQGKGTEIVVFLSFQVAEPESAVPELQAAESDQLPEQQKSCSLEGKRVLLVEDNEINREIATMVLEEFGVLVETAENGKLGYERMRQAPCGYFDLILMDVQMPIMNGYEATMAIRMLPYPWTKTIPIVAMTANAFAEDVAEAMEAGMDEHMAKPFQPARLQEILEKYLCK